MLMFLNQRPNGTIFVVAKADCELPRRAVRGDVVTFTHDFARRTGAHDPLAQDYTQTQEVVRGVPSNIVVHRIRTDIFWEDVVSNAGLPVRQFHNGLSFFSSLLFSAFFLLHFNQVCSHLFRVVPEN